MNQSGKKKIMILQAQIHQFCDNSDTVSNHPKIKKNIKPGFVLSDNEFTTIKK